METEKGSPACKVPMVKNATVSAIAQVVLQGRARHTARTAIPRGGRHPCLPVRVASCQPEPLRNSATRLPLRIASADRRAGEPRLPAARIAAATFFNDVRECVDSARQQALSSRMNLPPTQIQ